MRYLAPASMAQNASVALAKPGIGDRPRSIARRITPQSVLGETTIRPPAWATASTAPGLSTVPAP